MKAALVTGSARRIGAAIVRALADQGYAVAIHCIGSRQEADALAATCARAVVVTGDLADPATPAQLIAEAGAALGPLSLLVNNAALFEDDRFGALDVAGFDRHIAINLRAPLLLIDAFARQAPDTASIINIIDQRVLKPTPDHVSYALSKSALWTATRMAAQALAPRIRVNAVAPGPTLPNHNDGAAGFEREVAALPLARAVEPQEIANAVLYLAGAASVTGQMIAVDGGQHIGWRTPDVVALED